jgi:hypothetical protein
MGGWGEAPGRVEAVADAAWLIGRFSLGIFGVAISQSPKQPNCGPSSDVTLFPLGTSVGLCDCVEDLRALGRRLGELVGLGRT